MAQPSNKSNLAAHCEALSKEAHHLFPGVELHFLLHNQGQRQEVAEKLLTKLAKHPAIEEARGLLKFRKLNSDNSAFLGIAIGYERKLFGFQKSKKSLAFISINLNQHDTEEDQLLALYHLASQLFDLLDTMRRLNKGPERGLVLQPKRNNLSLARGNLKADIFSALQIFQSGHPDFVRDLACRRGLDALTARVNQHPEDFPFPIALDVTSYSAEALASAKKPTIADTFSTAQDIVRSFEKENIETWIQFVLPAQSMAWSGYTTQQILGAAVGTSPNPFIKATGHLIAEVTNITPAPEESLPSGYNPFLADEINQITHQRQIEETFEMVMVHAIEADSHLPLIRVANNQNESLMKGRFSGWCAHALQAAAKAYVGAIERGIPASQAAKLEFQTVQKQTGWNELMRTNSFVLGQHSVGEAVTLSSIKDWCVQHPELRNIMESISLTLADPAYALKLQAVNEMPTPKPAGPSLSAPAHHYAPHVAPAHEFAAAPAMGFGGGGMMSAPPVRRQSLPQVDDKLHLVDDSD